MGGDTQPVFGANPRRVALIIALTAAGGMKLKIGGSAAENTVWTFAADASKDFTLADHPGLVAGDVFLTAQAAGTVTVTEVFVHGSE